jgi:hypothetical protein
MKQKEERDLENALNWDETTPDFDEVLGAMRIDKEEAERFSEEIAGMFLKTGEPIILAHRRKRIKADLAKHWLIYEYFGRKEIRLLTVNQHIDGEKKYSFSHENNTPIFSYE